MIDFDSLSPEEQRAIFADGPKQEATMEEALIRADSLRRRKTYIPGVPRAPGRARIPGKARIPGVDDDG